MIKFEWEFPIKTISEMNCNECWQKKRQRHLMQKYLIRLFLNREIKKVNLPCTIELTRISTRMLDYDNLVASQKYVLDAICDLLIPGLRPGRADGDKRISTVYNQEKGKILGIRITIEFI